MDNIGYFRADSVQQAITLTQHHRSTFISGGTSLLDVMKDYVERHDALIDINHTDLDEIQDLPQGGLRIGTLVRNAPMAMDERIQSRYPAISQSILMAALPQIRNKATLGGNVMQRTRCSYFRDTAFACNRRQPGSGCPAITGLSRGHALLGGSTQCIASHASSLSVALVLYDAQVITQGPQGQRQFPFSDLHSQPGDTPQVENNLQPGEMITHIELPDVPWFAHASHAKVRDRFLYSNVQVVAALHVQQGHIRNARVALGGVATVPWRARQTEMALIDQPASEQTFDHAAQATVDLMQPTDDNRFKLELTKRLIKKALNDIVENADD